MFVHMVLYWFNPGAPPEAVAKTVTDCREMLARIPTVRHLWVGPPANTPRAVVDNSYTLGLLIVYDDRAGHDVYQPHALHQEFIARNKEHWARVQIYDFLE